MLPFRAGVLAPIWLVVGGVWLLVELTGALLRSGELVTCRRSPTTQTL